MFNNIIQRLSCASTDGTFSRNHSLMKLASAVATIPKQNKFNDMNTVIITCWSQLSKMGLMAVWTLQKMSLYS